MQKKNLILIFFVFLFLISFISATDLGTFKQGEDIELYQMCSNCSYVNLTSVKYPNSTVQIINEVMTKNNNDYTYSFNETKQVGSYQYNVCGDKNGVYRCEVLSFYITPSGFSIGSGESIGLFGSLILIILIGLIFLVIAIRSSNTTLKFSFYTFSVIIFVMAILYTVIIIQQTLFGFESILTGIESFWFIMKMLLTVGILAFFVVLFLIFLKMWKIKRGLYDE